ncbi:MAG: hypothetical protein ABL893_11050 [Hyphomicrobium sp.]
MSNSSSNPFNPAAFSALGDEQRKAMAAAFDAMSNWRQELNSMQEKNSAAVFDKMSSAAKSLGWPAEMVDMTRQQMQSFSKMQSQAIEQVMDTWEKQATQPGAKFEMPKFPGMPNFPGMPAMPNFPGMPSFPGMGGGATFPGMPDMSSIMGSAGSNPMMMPMQIWMQAADMWQKSFQQAMSSWADTQKTMMDNVSKSTKPGSGR